MKFQFKTSATMKTYNNKKWWIDPGIVRDITIKADTLTAAIKGYQNKVSEQYYINISDNAIKTKSPMYIDTKTGEVVQVGFVITASTDFENDQKGWTKQFIELWVNVDVVENPFEMEANQ